MMSEVGNQDSGVGRHAVPWNGFDVLFLFLLWFWLAVLCPQGLLILSGTTESAAANADVTTTSAGTTEHPLTRLVAQSRENAHAPMILLVAFVSGVILAPATEEFLFRRILQGWLHSRLQTALSAAGHTISGIISIVAVSLFFAALHGGRQSEQSTETLFYGTLGLAVANFLTLCIGAVYLRKKFPPAPMPATGLKCPRLISDLFLGCGVFLLIGPAILYLNVLLHEYFPGAATAPIPLFFFSLALGGLYFSTGRLVSSITLHACLNGFSYGVLVWSVFL